MNNPIYWSDYPVLDRRLVELLNEHGYLASGELHQLIATTMNTEFFTKYGLNFSPDAIRNRAKRIKFAQLDERPVTVLMPHYAKYKDTIEGLDPAPPKMLKGTTLADYLQTMQEGRRKTLVLSDLHIPFQADDLIQRAVERNLTADLVVINGDVLDAYALSTFVKTKSVPIFEELDGVVRFFEWITTVFPDVFIVITEGNHEARFIKRITPMMPEGLEFLADTAILAKLARPFPTIAVVGDWFVQVGDAIYAHSEAASGVPGRPATDTLDWFINHREQEELEPFTFVTQAHTHRVSVIYRGRYKAVESGSLCIPMSYSRTTKHKNPQMNGYVVNVQQDGVSDFHESREYVLTRES